MVADQVFLWHLPVVPDVNGSYQSVSPPLPPTILPLGATDTDQPPPGFGTPVPSLHRSLEHHQFRTKCLSLANPRAIMCPALTKSPRSKLLNWPESFPTQFLWGQCIFLLFSRFLTYYFSFSLVNIIVH